MAWQSFKFHTNLKTDFFIKKKCSSGPKVIILFQLPGLSALFKIRGYNYNLFSQDFVDPALIGRNKPQCKLDIHADQRFLRHFIHNCLVLLKIGN